MQRRQLPLNIQEKTRILSDTSLRDKLIFLLLLETGMALQEIVLIKKGHIRKNNLLVGKASARRTILLSSELCRALTLFLKEQTNDGTAFSSCSSRSSRSSRSFPSSPAFHSGGYLFSTRESPVITIRRIEQILSVLGKRTIGRPINPRMLRATHIIDAFSQGVPVVQIEQNTGLKSIQAHLYKYFSVSSDPARRWGE